MWVKLSKWFVKMRAKRLTESKNNNNNKKPCGKYEEAEQSWPFYAYNISSATATQGTYSLIIHGMHESLDSFVHELLWVLACKIPFAMLPSSLLSAFIYKHSFIYINMFFFFFPSFSQVLEVVAWTFSSFHVRFWCDLWLENSNFLFGSLSVFLLFRLLSAIPFWIAHIPFFILRHSESVYFCLLPYFWCFRYCVMLDAFYVLSRHKCILKQS